jgi:hypothetical protein
MAEIVKQEGEFKVKPRKMKQLSDKPKTIKVDLSKKPEENKETGDTIKVDITDKKKQEDAVQINTTDESNDSIGESENSQSSEEVVEEVRPSEEKIKEDSVIQEITEEEVQEQTETLQEQVEDAVQESQDTAEPLPENIQKVVDFMNETGGTLEDYVRLNADYSNVDNNTLLREYYRQSKPHLDSEDVNILLEDFAWDEDTEEEKDIRKKKVAYKEEVAKAKGFLEKLKDKYYDEIKLRPGVTQEQQKAVDFFNRYSEEQQVIKKRTEDFQSRTKNYFNDEFKGFDFNLGEKKFRYGIKDNASVADFQSDMGNFIKKFLDKEGRISNMTDYHKALYVANNSDKVINHFYEQGKADAIRDLTNKSKNISDEPRSGQSGNVFINGLRVKSVSGADSSKLKIKTKR